MTFLHFPRLSLDDPKRKCRVGPASNASDRGLFHSDHVIAHFTFLGLASHRQYASPSRRERVFAAKASGGCFLSLPDILDLRRIFRQLTTTLGWFNYFACTAMALLQYPAPVDYTAQLDAFKDFLKNFKTFESASEAAATEAIEDLHIDGDATSDEYDFMDDSEDGNEAQRPRRRREPKLKYMQMLQDVADRERTNILIELDDLATVSCCNLL